MKKNDEEEVSSLEDEEPLSDLGKDEMWEQGPTAPVQKKVEDEGIASDRAFIDGVNQLKGSFQQTTSLAPEPSHHTEPQLPVSLFDHEDALQYDGQYEVQRPFQEEQRREGSSTNPFSSRKSIEVGEEFFNLQEAIQQSISIANDQSLKQQEQEEMRLAQEISMETYRMEKKNEAEEGDHGQNDKKDKEDDKNVDDDVVEISSKETIVIKSEKKAEGMVQQTKRKTYSSQEVELMLLQRQSLDSLTELPFAKKLKLNVHKARYTSWKQRVKAVEEFQINYLNVPKEQLPKRTRRLDKNLGQIGNFYEVKKRRIEVKKQVEEYQPTIPELDPNFKFYNPQYLNLEEASQPEPETQDEEEIESFEADIHSISEGDYDSYASTELEVQEDDELQLQEDEIADLDPKNALTKGMKNRDIYNPEN